MEGKGQALDLPSSLRALSSRGRRTPQTIKHVASQGRAADSCWLEKFLPQWVVVGHSSEQ